VARADVTPGVRGISTHRAYYHQKSSIPEDRVGYHVCRGSWNGPHSNDVNLRDIVDLVLSVNVGGQARSLPPPSCGAKQRRLNALNNCAQTSELKHERQTTNP
jgi:hypothetical protein